MLRRVLLAAVAACTFGLASAQAQSDKPEEFRVGLLGGENTQDRLARYGKFQQLLEQKLGMPVKLFPAADYAGVMQGIAAGQLEMAGFGASGFAGAWLDCKCVEPIVVPQENDGSPTTIPFRDRRASRFADQVARRHEGAFGLGRLWVILA